MAESPDPQSNPPLSTALADTANVLVLAPAATSAGEAACFDLLSTEPPGEAHVLVVSADLAPDPWYRAWRRRVGGTRPASVGFVAIGEQSRGAASAGTAPAVPPAIAVRAVEHPGDLSSIGVAVTKLFSKWPDDASVVVCVRSLGSLLAATDLRRTYQFLHVLTGHIQTRGAVGHYHLDPATVDANELSTLLTLFDAAIERDGDGEWTVRSRR